MPRDMRMARALRMMVRVTGMAVAKVTMGIMRNRVTAAAAHDARLLRTPLVDAMSFDQAGIDAKRRRRDASARRLSAERTGDRLLAVAHGAPIGKGTVPATFVAIKRHDHSSWIRTGSGNVPTGLHSC